MIRVYCEMEGIDQIAFRACIGRWLSDGSP